MSMMIEYEESLTSDTPDWANTSIDGPSGMGLLPLRTALMSLAHVGQPSTLVPQKPLVAGSTQKSRALRELGLTRRHGQCRTAPAEPVQSGPSSPEEAGRPRLARKTISSTGTISRRAAIHRAEEIGNASWPTVTHSQSAPTVVVGCSRDPGNLGVKNTWTSAARALLSHSRRNANDQAGGRSPTNAPAMALTVASSRSGQDLPEPVKDWAKRGLEFRNGGFSIGARFKEDAPSSPQGLIYNQPHVGSVALYSPKATLPTKQPCAKHFSSQAHRFGVRRDPTQQRAAWQQPGPGAYESAGFAEEIIRKAARSPKAQRAPEDGLDPYPWN